MAFPFTFSTAFPFHICFASTLTLQIWAENGTRPIGNFYKHAHSQINHRKHLLVTENAPNLIQWLTLIWTMQILLCSLDEVEWCQQWLPHHPSIINCLLHVHIPHMPRLFQCPRDCLSALEHTQWLSIHELKNYKDSQLCIKRYLDSDLKDWPIFLIPRSPNSWNYHCVNSSYRHFLAN